MFPTTICGSRQDRNQDLILPVLSNIALTRKLFCIWKSMLSSFLPGLMFSHERVCPLPDVRMNGQLAVPDQ
tara:strand:+ start:163 stop:375 length:213 start_codon:yes stop_codon:yes gene_type:complete